MELNHLCPDDAIHDISEAMIASRDFCGGERQAAKDRCAENGVAFTPARFAAADRQVKADPFNLPTWTSSRADDGLEVREGLHAPGAEFAAIAALFDATEGKLR